MTVALLKVSAPEPREPKIPCGMIRVAFSTSVPPEWVLFPVKVNVPAPVLITLPVPLTALKKVWAAVLAIIKLALSVILPTRLPSTETPSPS